MAPLHALKWRCSPSALPTGLFLSLPIAQTESEAQRRSERFGEEINVPLLALSLVERRFACCPPRNLVTKHTTLSRLH